MRRYSTGLMLVGAALLATSAFAQGGRGPGGGIRPGGMAGGGGTAGAMAGGCSNVGGNQVTAGAFSAAAQAAIVARMYGLNSGSNGPIQTGFEPEMQQALAQQAYARQQARIAAEKAAREQERRDKIKATIIARREKEEAKKGKLLAAKSSAGKQSDAFETSR